MIFFCGNFNVNLKDMFISKSRLVLNGVLFGITMIAFLSIPMLSFCQETKSVSKKVSETLEEKYNVLKSDKKIKTGEYKVVDYNKNVFVKGEFANNKKVGVWSYFGTEGKLVQQYDFSANKLIMEDEDPKSIVREGYDLVGVVTNDGDKIEPPVKIGGGNYGFYLLYDIRSIPMAVRNEMATIESSMQYIFFISEKGELISWDIIYADKTDDPKREKPSIKGLPADAYEFIPAKVNGKPVKSKLLYSVKLTIAETNSPRTGQSNYIPKN